MTGKDIHYIYYTSHSPPFPCVTEASCLKLTSYTSLLCMKTYNEKQNITHSRSSCKNIIDKCGNWGKINTHKNEKHKIPHFKGYHTLQGDNSLKSVERFDHMMFVCRFQAYQWSKPQREKLLCGYWIYSSESVGGNLLKF